FRMNPLWVLFFSSLSFSVHAYEQAVGARGTIMCGHEPIANAEVKLMELDTWPDPDDLMASVYTDSQGHFQIQGHESELFQINPVVKIYHRCN
ncbi:hypothetical protein PENTCL1PPCAC_3093, partial [Pristionchus entomophagus]